MLLGIIALIADIALIFMNRNTQNGRRVSFASLYGYASSVGGGIGIALSGMDTESRIENYRYCMSALVSTLIIFLLFSVFSILTSNRAGVYGLVSLFSIILGIGSIFFFGYSAIISIGSALKTIYLELKSVHEDLKKKIGELDSGAEIWDGDAAGSAKEELVTVLDNNMTIILYILVLHRI